MSRLGTHTVRWMVAAALIGAECVATPFAAARPALPLAPACSSYRLPAFTNLIAGETTVFIGWAPDGKSGRANTGGYGGNGSMGDVTGGLNGRHADILIHWDQGPEGGNKWQFLGDVRDDLTLDGTVRLGGNTVNWHSEGPVECVSAASGNSPGAGQTTATVVQPVDVYNQPDGQGVVYRDADGHTVFLPAGRQVQLVQPCRDSWCQVVDPDVPGDAWVYQNPFLQFP